MRRNRPALLFLLLLALYLLTYAPTLHSSDGQAMFATAESLARRGAWDIEQIRWMGLQQGTYGLDGLLYSRKGIGQPLLALPLTWLGVLLPGFGPVTSTVLFGALTAALTGVLILATLSRLGYDERTGLLAALVYGTGTLAWPYAKTFFSDPLAGLLLLAALWALLNFNQTRRRRYPFIAGLSLAWATATRYAEGIFLPLFGLLLLAYLAPKPLTAPSLRANRQSLFAPTLLFSLPIAVTGLGLMAFNVLRYGDPLNTGYLPQETFSAVWWQGIYGQLLSPGRGLLLYSPILLLSFFGLRSCWRQHRAAALTCLAVILIHLLLYGKWFMWHGGFAWGPRFMVATIPFWIILMAPVLKQLTGGAKPAWRYGFYLLWGVSLIVQLPGFLVDFDLWQNRLLQSGLPMFDPITFFAPAYSPLLNTWQFITLPNLDVAWASRGQIAWPLLSILSLNLIAAAWPFLASLRTRPPVPMPERTAQQSGLAARLRAIAPTGYLALLTFLTLFFLLRHAHQSLTAGLAGVLGPINQTPAAIIYHNPETAIPLAEGYKGRAPVLGLTTLEVDRLEAFVRQTPATWWLSTYQNDIETYLLDIYGIARDETFAPNRLMLLARPAGASRAIEARFDDGITLQAARLSTALSPNSPFAVELTWRADRTPSIDYQVFIHLTDAAGQIVAQTDGQPVHWTRPTTTWLPHETIIDRHAFWAGALAPGAYTLISGLYQPATGERLLTERGDHFIPLGTFDLKP